ncbi:MAG: DUF1059 domain-containing protein [Thermomicrobiales bacterium]
MTGQTTLVVRCSCGAEMRDTDEAALIRAVKAHAKEHHQLEFSDDQVRTLIEVEPAGSHPAAG